MDSRLLRYFLAVYESRGISAAAEELRISQPALTKSIQKLEADLGAQLFERMPGGVVPTRYADILARRVRLMDIEYRHAIAEIEAARGGSEGLIRVGAGPVWYSCFLPEIIGTFQSDNPDIRVRVEGGVITTLIPALEAGDYDLVCASLDFPNRADIAKEPVVSLKHVVIASDHHALSGAAPVDPAELANAPWVVLADDHVGTGRIWSYFAAHGCAPPRIAIETSSQTLMFEMVARGPYVAHIPEIMLGQAARYGVVPLKVPGTFWETPAGLVTRQSESRLPALGRFIDAIRAALADHGPP
jgi:DNA-binding transcriptional LysR family regulator